MNAYFVNRIFKPSNDHEFWCSGCDSIVVKTSDESTGKFFLQFGHSYSQRTKDYDGEYTGVMFAVCSNCLDE